MRTRDTAKDAVRNLLENLPDHKNKEDALRMVDREIGGLLAHPASPMANTYQVNERVLFPRGLEATFPGKDIILILNSKEIDISHRGKTQKYTIPKALKNPEKGVASIIGKELAQTLFKVRGEILGELVRTDSNWGINLEVNKKAQEVINALGQQSVPFAIKTPFTDRVKEDPVVSGFAKEEQKILDTFLSSLIWLDPSKKDFPTWSESIKKSASLVAESHVTQLVVQSQINQTEKAFRQL